MQGLLRTGIREVACDDIEPMVRCLQESEDVPLVVLEDELRLTTVAIPTSALTRHLLAALPLTTTPPMLRGASFDSRCPHTSGRYTPAGRMVVDGVSSFRQLLTGCFHRELLS